MTVGIRLFTVCTVRSLSRILSNEKDTERLRVPCLVPRVPD